MYKLVFIEDEVLLRKSIIEKIEWEKCGFIVAGEAENGRDALDIIDYVCPDVIITDIDMPFLNGMELSKIVTEKYPMMKIVLLSGYDEFRYAQKAIELNVLEYVLKPVSSEELTKILLRIKEKIDDEIAKNKNIEALKEHYLESLPVLRLNFLSSLITEKQSKEDILRKAVYYNLDFNGEYFAAAVISIDKSRSNENKFNEEERTLLGYGVLNTIEEIAYKTSLGIAFSHHDYIVIIMKGDEEDKEYTVNNMFKGLEEIRQYVEKYMSATITIGVGNLCTSPSRIKQSFHEALSALEYRFVMGNNKILFIQDLEPVIKKKIVFSETKEKQLLSSIKFGTQEEVFSVMETLFKDFAEEQTSIGDYQIYLVEMIATIIKVSKDLNLDINTIFGNKFNLFVEMFKFDTIGEVKGWFKDICSKLMKLIEYRRRNSGKILIEKAMDYIKENYRQSDLSLNTMSNYLHISPNYFGSTFKNETGETFVNYLLRIRMEAARNLLCSTNDKNQQISEKVGIPDQYYFSHCFKKIFNISPNEFRNSLKNKEL